MPHDRNGVELAAGDEVILRANDIRGIGPAADGQIYAALEAFWKRRGSLD